MKITLKFISILNLISLFIVNSFAQNLQIEKLSKLEKIIDETSGLLWFNDTLYTHNDSDGEPCLYAVDLNTGNVLNTQCYEQVKNYDWEDITSDDNYVYIGEIGNNSGTINPLMIFRLKKEDFYNNKANLDTIAFSFADQKEFVPKFRHTNYDCESLFDVGDKLIVLSKNWQDLNSRIYFVPKQSGTYSLMPILEFEAKGLITGADFNEELGVLALIGYEKNIPFNSLLFILKFNEDFTSIKNFIRIKLPVRNKQTEGIVWETNKTLLVSNESLLNVPAQLNRISLENCNLLEFVCKDKPNLEHLIKYKPNLQIKLSDVNENIIYVGKLKKIMNNQAVCTNISKPAIVSWKSKKLEAWFVLE